MQKSNRYCYGLVNRPASIGAVPNGEFSIEPSLDGDGRNYSRHGVIVYSRPLTEKEIYDFELSVIADSDLVEELAIFAALNMKEYASQYIGMANGSYESFKNHVFEQLKGLRKYRVYVGSLDRFCLMVKCRLENTVAHQ
jgi:hypothetical protein